MLERANLSRHFGGVKALDGLDLPVRQGEILGLIGRNGSGKSSTVNLIAGLRKPTLGSLRFQGQEIGNPAPHERAQFGIKRTFQNIRLFAQLSVWQNLWAARVVHEGGWAGFKSRWLSGSAAARQEAEALLAFSGLADKRDVLAGNLAFGEQRRLALARAAASGAPLLLPTMRLSGLHYAVATLAFGEMVRLALQSWTFHHAAADGLVGPAGLDGFRDIRWLLENNVSPRAYWLLVVAVLAVALLTVGWLERHRLGLALRAVGHDDMLAAAQGLPELRLRLLAATLAGARAAARLAGRSVVPPRGTGLSAPACPSPDTGPGHPMRSLACCLTLLASTSSAVAALRPVVDLQCVAHGSGPLLDCTARVSVSGAPLGAAKLTLGASMPSMPMAHTVKPVAAMPTGRPGEYRGTLQLEMNGDWAVQIDLAGPPRERIVRVLRVDDCPGDQRCPVAAVRDSAQTPSRKP